MRTAVLLDELDFPGFGLDDPRTGVIVAELKTTNALPLLQANCSPRIVGVPTSQLNARRHAGNAAARDVIHAHHVRSSSSNVVAVGRSACVAVHALQWSPLMLTSSGTGRAVRLRPKMSMCRLARMFEHPIVADVSKSIWSFHSRSQVYVEPCPSRLQSLQFGQLFKWFPDGIVLGLLNRYTGSCLIAPDPATKVQLSCICAY